MNKAKISAYTIIITCLVAGVLILVVGIIPMAFQLISGQQELNSLNDSMRELTKKAETLTSINEPQLRNRLNIANTALPTEKSTPGIYGGMERAARTASASVELFSISPGKISTESGKSEEIKSGNSESGLPNNMGQLSFQVGIKGSVDQAVEFLRTLENSVRIIGFSRMEYRLTSGQKGSPPIVLSLNAYYQPLPATLGAVTTPLTNLVPLEEAAIQKISAFDHLTGSPTFSPTGKTNPFE